MKNVLVKVITAGPITISEQTIGLITNTWRPINGLFFDVRDF